MLRRPLAAAVGALGLAALGAWVVAVLTPRMRLLPAVVAALRLMKATLLAVAGGALFSERISERAVGITGGVLFLVFALATLAGVF